LHVVVLLIIKLVPVHNESILRVKSPGLQTERTIQSSRFKNLRHLTDHEVYATNVQNCAAVPPGKRI